jgi:hypothetical protein
MKIKQNLKKNNFFFFLFAVFLAGFDAARI